MANESSHFSHSRMGGSLASLKDILSRASAEGVPFDRAMVVELPNKWQRLVLGLRIAIR